MKSIYLIQLYFFVIYLVSETCILTLSKFSQKPNNLGEILLLLAGAIEILFIPTLVWILFQKLQNVRFFWWLRNILWGILGFLYILLSIYVYRSGSPFDYGLSAGNAALLSNDNSWGVISDLFYPFDVFLMVFSFILPSILLLKEERQISSWSRRSQGLFLVSFFLLLLPFLADFKPRSRFNEFLWGTKNYLYPRVNAFNPPEIMDQATFKVQALESSQAPISVLDYDHVFIILMESFNRKFVERQIEVDGVSREVTPYFNSLIKQGIYFEHFFGNSMQTAKGHFATLCGQIPHRRLKEMEALKNLNLSCLPTLFKNNGFKTFFIQALDDLSFDNTGPFWQSHGMSYIDSMSRDKMSPEDMKYWWGWGLQDDQFYKKSLDIFDREKSAKNFVVLATISNHMKFKGMPQNYKKIHPEINDRAPIQLRFHNSLAAMDLFLESFFMELDRKHLRHRSLVILLGDHGFPIGEHGIFSPENKFFNENFKVPLLILGPNIKPQRITQYKSQIDLAATLSAVFLSKENKLLSPGEDLFNGRDSVVPLIQPYDGVYISIIKDRKKFIHHFNTQNNFLYDLSRDPEENNDLYKKSDSDLFIPYFHALKRNDLFLENANTIVKFKKEL